MRIPERNVTYIVLAVFLLTFMHRYPLNRKQPHYAALYERLI